MTSESTFKRKRDLEEDGGSIFYEVEDDGIQESGSEDELEKETPEEKRLRLGE